MCTAAFIGPGGGLPPVEGALPPEGDLPPEGGYITSPLCEKNEVCL